MRQKDSSFSDIDTFAEAPTLPTEMLGVICAAHCPSIDMVRRGLTC